MIWAPIIAGLLGCSPAGGDSGEPAVLPPEESPVSADTGFAVDTALTQSEPADESPQDSLLLSQEGSWEMSPLGGPYTALTGTLESLEILNGDEEVPVCALLWSLTGQGLDSGGCAGCDFTFEVEFYLSEGDPASCYDPELPESGETWRLGYDPAEGALLREYEGTGVWIPWFQASVSGDTVDFSWSATVGVVPSEDP